MRDFSVVAGRGPTKYSAWDRSTEHSPQVRLWDNIIEE